MNDYDYTEQVIARQTASLHALEDALGIVRDAPIADDVGRDAPEAWFDGSIGQVVWVLVAASLGSVVLGNLLLLVLRLIERAPK